MYCRHCGAFIPDDSVFCSKCGKNVSEIEPQTEEFIPESSEQNPEEKYEEQIDWYYRDEQGEVGPCTQNDIETAIRRGQVNVEGKVKEVAISDQWIWCLAIIPMLLSLILTRTRTTFGIPYLPWIVPLALNLLFIWLDQKDLINAEMLAESWMYMGIVIVPAYLVVREIKTNHNYSPAIIWCFLFALGFFI